MSKPGQCIRCGKPVGDNEAFCPRCKANVNEPVRPVKKMWWHRHPHLTYILGCVVYLVAAAFLLAARGQYELNPWVFWIVLMALIGLLCWLTVWYLIQKKREWMWVFLILIPFGWIVILGLTDNTQGRDT
jgi:heme/copper-type cytochrome/quinol oxidase subunit 4